MKIDVKVPDGKSGDYQIETFEVNVDSANLHNIRAIMKPGNRTIEPGMFKRLMRSDNGFGGTVVMSNTPAEVEDHWEFFDNARTAKTVLINGLGLGVILTKLLAEDTLEKVTIIEVSPDVIKLTSPTFENDSRVEIIQADALEYRPPVGVRYDVVWHDIWDYICEDNLESMKKLHRKYGRRCGWQGSWCRELCER